MITVEQATIRYREPPGSQVGLITLDGVEQHYVTAFNIAEGWLERGFTGEPVGKHQIKMRQTGCVFDTKANDYVFERVTGKVEATWKDRDLAQRWLNAREAERLEKEAKK